MINGRYRVAVTYSEFPTDRPGTRSRLGFATRVAAVAAVVALAFAAWFGIGWVRASLDDGAPRAHAREAVLDGARQAAVNLNSMNPDDVDGSMKLMQSSMTGQMLDDYKSNSDRIRQAAGAGKTKLTAKVIGASVTELNSELNHAKVLVVLLQTSAADTGTSTQRVTWVEDMVKAGDSWKAQDATSLGSPVLVDAGATAPTGNPQPNQHAPQSGPQPQGQPTDQPSAQPQPPKSGN